MHKSKILLLLILALFSTMLFAGCSGGSLSVTTKEAKWDQMQHTLLGVRGSETKYGVLVTNDNSVAIDVKVTAKFYAADDSYLGEESGSLTCIPKGQSLFAFVRPHSSIEDEVDHVEYTTEVEKSSHTFADLSWDLKDGKYYVTNNGKDKARGCILQQVYYDADGNIVFVDYVSFDDIPAGEMISEDAMEWPPELMKPETKDSVDLDNIKLFNQGYYL